MRMKLTSVFLLYFSTCTLSLEDENETVPIRKIPTVTSATTTITTSSTTTATPSKNLSQKQRLRRDLLKTYDKLVHPVDDSRESVEVELGLAVIHFDVNEQKSIFSADVWMRMRWNDSFLLWDPADYGNVDNLHFGDGEIWKPDILLYNSADEAKIDPYGNTHHLVKHTGEVLWVPPAHFKAYCKLDMRHWPMDKQTCKLKFGSWTSNGREIDINLYKDITEVEKLNFYTNNREWELVSTNGRRNVITYACCPEPYPDVTYEFKLARNSPAYKSTIILPCLVIMLMTVCCFLLPPNAGEKVIINGTAFLASVMYLLYFAFTIPFHSLEVPILVMFFSNTTALIGISLLLNVTCISMCRERKFSGPPKFLKELFSGSVGKFLCLGHYYHQVSSTHHRLVLELTDMAESDQLESQQASSNNTNGGIIGNDQDDNDFQERNPTQMSLGASRDNDGSAIMKEWTLVAAGLERFFFIVYSIAFAVVTTIYI